MRAKRGIGELQTIKAIILPDLDQIRSAVGENIHADRRVDMTRIQYF